MYVDLDIAYEEGTLEEACADLARDDATWRVVDESGPGGGWPIVRFEGRSDALLRLIKRYAPEDADEYWPVA